MPLPSDAVHSGHRLATRFLMMHPRRRSLKELAVGEPAAGAGSSLPDMMMNAVVGGLQAAVPASVWDDLWVMQIPPAEKVLRTVAVYAAILLIVRLAGKRLLAQMNSLDLVVVLLLSNVVQNAIIGADNSLSGGVLGAIVLVSLNAALERLTQVWPALGVLLEGRPTTVVRDGQFIDGSLDRLGVSRRELDGALRRQGADNIAEVRRAEFDPGGSIVVDLEPREQGLSRGEFQDAMARLTARLDELAPPTAS